MSFLEFHSTFSMIADFYLSFFFAWEFQQMHLLMKIFFYSLSLRQWWDEMKVGNSNSSEIEAPRRWKSESIFMFSNNNNRRRQCGLMLLSFNLSINFRILSLSFENWLKFIHSSEAASNFPKTNGKILSSLKTLIYWYIKFLLLLKIN